MKSDVTLQGSCVGLSAVDLSDRFQGALLGLQLAPAALDYQHASSRPYASRFSEQTQLHQAINYSMAQTSAFVSAPNVWAIDSLRLPDSTFLLPACVPVLLRYHHSWRRRLDWLTRLKSQSDGLDASSKNASVVWHDEALASFRQRLAQIALLGDLLEAIGRGLLPASWLSWLTERTANYRRERFLSAQYEMVLSAIWEGCPFECPIGDAAHRAFAVGVSSAMMHSESYSLAVRCSAREALMHTPEANAQSISRSADGWMAAFVAGLLSGAAGGKRGLPVLWQLRLSADSQADDRAALADALFMLWSGQRH